jgi:radical SAM protein with 4Fe4S-binding SPASM domain
VGKKMSEKAIKHLVEGVSSFRSKIVTFSGGEPLLYKNWYRAAKMFKENGATISLTTNGVFIEKNAKKIKDVVDELNLSLQAPPDAIHLVRDDPPEHFKKILKGICIINNFKKKYGRPRLKILCTISDMNYEHLEGLVLFMKKEKIAVDQFYFQHMMFLDKKTRIEQQKVFEKKFGIKKLPLWDGFTYPFPKSVDFADFKKRLHKLSQYHNVVFSPDLPLDELENYYLHQKKPAHYSNYCIAPWTQLNILPNGDCYVCNDYILGNLDRSAFNEVWNGKRAKKLREHLSKELFPACKRCFYYYCDRNE